MSESVSQSELRRRAEKWRRQSEYMLDNLEEYESPSQTKGAAQCMADIADEIEGLLND